MKILYQLTLVCCLISIVINQSLAQEHYISIDNLVSELKLDQKGKFPYNFKPNTESEKVKEKMTSLASLFQEDSLFITYTVYFDKDKVDFADISFDFPKGQMTSASIETYLGSKDQSDKAFNSVKANFDKLYGSGEFREETFYWKYKKKGKTFEVQLWQIDYEGDNGFGIDYLYY